MILSRDIGIDLGTATTMICDRKGRIIVREPSVVAVDVKTKRVVASGTQAKQMIGRTPGSIVAVRPLKNGVIADFDMTADMLHSFIFRSDKRSMFSKTRVVISVPSGVTEVERRAVEDAVRSAAALGAGLPVYEPTGSMIVDIGGGTTDVAVLSLGGIAACKSIKVGGEAMDEAIIDYIKKHHNLLIGEPMAEEIKLKIGSAAPYDGEGAMEVRGRNLTDGLPGAMEITSAQVREILTEPVQEIIRAIKETLEVILPELAADIMDRGIYLTGGSSTLRGLADLIEQETKIKIHIPDAPTDCVAIGTSIKLRRAR